MAGPKEGRTWQRLQRQCVSCENYFHSHPRLGNRQKTCGSETCQRKQRAGYRRGYRSKNRQSEQEYEEKRKSCRPPDFWKKYREAHPAYTQRNRAQSLLRNRLKKAGLQRHFDIVQLVDPEENLGVVIEFVTSHRSLLNRCLCRPAA